MARRGSKSAGAKAASGIGRLFGIPTGVKRTFFMLFFILLGGLLFNLDRMGDTGILLLKYKQFLPHYVTRFLPGGGASFGSALPEQQLAGQIIEVYDGDTATLLTKENVGPARRRRSSASSPATPCAKRSSAGR